MAFNNEGTLNVIGTGDFNITTGKSTGHIGGDKTSQILFIGGNFTFNADDTVVPKAYVGQGGTVTVGDDQAVARRTWDLRILLTT